LRDPEADLKLTVLLSCLRVTVLGCPPLPEETLGVIAVVGVRGVRRQIRCDSSRRGGRRLTGPGRKWTKVVIQDEPINKLEKSIAISRRYRSHLIQRRHWLIGWFFSGTSSTARLPLLSSPAIRSIGSMKRGKKPTTEFARAEKCKGTGAVASVDVFEAGALGWYL